jgi:hypothetical protein
MSPTISFTGCSDEGPESDPPLPVQPVTVEKITIPTINLFITAPAKLNYRYD